MATTGIGSAAAIVGMGRALARRDDPDGPRTPLQLGAIAARRAMAAAGITRAEVGALFTGRTPQSYMVLQYNQALLNELKIGPTFNTEVTSHGAARSARCSSPPRAACRGDRLSLCVTNEASGLWMDQVGSNAAWESDLQFEAPYGARRPRSTPSSPAVHARDRHDAGDVRAGLRREPPLGAAPPSCGDAPQGADHRRGGARLAHDRLAAAH